MDLEYSIEAAQVARSALSMLRPYDVVGQRKVRLGRHFDGGYVMIDAFQDVKTAYSLGINDDVSWDLDMALRGVEIYQYDHTIEALPVENPRFHWQKLGIAATSSGDLRSIPDLIRENKHEGARDMILKCDIECHEWDVLRDIPNSILSQFSQIVLELHDMPRVGNMRDDGARQALVNLTASHNVVHVHANNFARFAVVGGFSVPHVIELTLLRKDMGEFVPSTETFPTSMDMPCHSLEADLWLGSFTFG